MKNLSMIASCVFVLWGCGGAVHHHISPSALPLSMGEYKVVTLEHQLAPTLEEEQKIRSNLGFTMKPIHFSLGQVEDK